MIRFLSYPFGSDAIAGLVDFGYRRFGLFDIKASIFFMTHGVVGKFSRVNWYGPDTGDDVTHTPSTVNPFEKDESGEYVSGVPEYRLVLGIDGSYQMCSFFSFSLGLDFITIWNMNNESSPPVCDLQLSVGATISYGR